MNWNIPFTTDRTERAPTIAAFIALVAVLGVAGIAVFGGGVAAEEVSNTNVSVDNSTAEIYVEAAFNDSIADADADAHVVIEDPNGAEFVNTTISGNASETIVEEFTVNDSDPDGDYSVVVTTDPSDPTNVTHVDSVSVGTFAESSGGGGGSADDADGWGTYQGYPVWMIAVGSIAAALIGHSREWWDLSEVAP